MNSNNSPDTRKQNSFEKTAQTLEQDDTFRGKSFGGSESDYALYDFWHKYRGALLRIILLGLMAFALIECFKWLEQYKLKKIQQEYSVAQGTDEQLAFANRHSNSALAGIVFLQMADKLYIEGDYLKASNFYTKAYKALAKNELGERAQLGLAMAELLGIDPASGLKRLQILARDPKAQLGIRAEAYYQQVILAASRGDYAEGKELIKALQAMDPSSSWAQKALQLQAATPELALN